MDAESPLSPLPEVPSAELDRIYGNVSDSDTFSVSTHWSRAANEPAEDPHPEIPQDEEKSYMFFCFWRNRWARNFLLSPLFFLVCVCLGIFGDAVASGAVMATTTSVDIRYRLTALEMGILTMVYSIGNMIALPFVSYFAGRPRAKRPRWIAIGTMVEGLGIMLYTLPQFISDKYDVAVSEVRYCSGAV